MRGDTGKPVADFRAAFDAIWLAESGTSDQTGCRLDSFQISIGTRDVRIRWLRAAKGGPAVTGRIPNYPAPRVVHGYCYGRCAYLAKSATLSQ